MDIKKRILHYGSNPVFVLCFVILVSAVSLASALTAEHVFGLEPCILCIYQRYPFAFAIGIGVTGLFLTRHSMAGRTLPLAFCGIAFLVNTGIATHHVGVEQKWWTSFSEGCAVEGINSVQGSDQLLEQIMSSPVVPCDQIPWEDPIFGLSMAVYNALLSFGMTFFCLITLVLIARGPRPHIDIKV